MRIFFSFQVYSSAKEEPTNNSDDVEEDDSQNEIHHSRIMLNTPNENKKFRHHRLLRQQIVDLEHSTKELQSGQSRLDHIIHRIEKRIKSVETDHSKGNRNTRDNESVDERLPERVARLEEAGRTTSRQLFNVTRQVAELDRLHISMLQLLESVETLENKVDKNIPELQREISKMEFNMAQTTSTVSLVKEDQVSMQEKFFIKKKTRIRRHFPNSNYVVIFFYSNEMNFNV